MAQVETFVWDESPDAFEKVVDRLLSSEHYGEHMAHYWLDAVRYGDTHGLHLDNYREIWPYRDWVVKAFNRNLPYDQFVTEQLAGDLLPDASQDQLVATGFNRCNVSTNEGGSIKDEVNVRNVVDRVVAFGTVFMAMTFECTRCHDHKYDPFTMDDFYSMFAYFNSIDGDPMDGNRKDHAPVVRVPTDEQRSRLGVIDRQIARLGVRLRDPWPEIDELQTTWEQQLAAVDQSLSSDGSRLTLGDWHTVGPFRNNKRYVFRRPAGPEGKPVRLDQKFRLPTGETVNWSRRPEWVDGRVHLGLPGDIAANYLYRTIDSVQPQQVTLSLGSDDALKVYLNNNEVLANDVARGAAADQDTLELALHAGENHLLLKVANYGGESGFYFAVTSGQAISSLSILELAALPDGQRTSEQRQTLRDHFRNRVLDSDKLHAVRDELAQARSRRSEVEKQIPTTLVWREKAKAVPAFYLNRGEYDRRGREVSRRTPDSLPPMAADWPTDRLGLALWLVDRSHPLTARVAVNRLWQQVFGTGLVKTAEDFGSQGEPPSHPELLDWQATQFMDDGWDIKALMKRIVMSATYRQASQLTPELQRRDPENRLLARGPRFRLEAEMLRDQALFLSGLLVPQVGGPSVKPPQPDGLWFAVGYSRSNTVHFKADTGPDKVHRRSLYTFIKRTSPPPQMSTFDGPSREAPCIGRERTNTPLQALLLFNDPQFVEAACGLARRTMRKGDNTASARAAYMFRLCTARQPTNAETDDLVRGFNQDHETFKHNPQAATALVQVGSTPTADDLDTSELAAWTITASLLLNLDEVLTKE